MYDPDTFVERVIDAVGAAADRPPEQLPPLYESIDTEALATVLGHAHDRPAAQPRIEFPYAGFTVRVTTYTVAVVEEGDDRRDATTVETRRLR
ncbi:HalOD1 output domain-containing protein [Halobaculum lipolyticum]|uniref:HalOD1 output domain-containing protein n=1 Tax=Halobaculum lipolyticum TaxID=3032001 RepID=A0ABD5WBB0_9EURY|nr:HalOD1 output domain-containing protein [Halobaculum sp. DT31]